MDNKGVEFIVSVLFGVIIAFGIAWLLSEGGLAKCADIENVYECEWVVVPVQREIGN